MKQAKLLGNIAFLSTYPPRECGIALFTEDLITTMGHSGTLNTHVVAINNSENYSYDKKVMAEIRRDERNDYIDIAKKLNTLNLDLLVIEHEYEIYGGDQGDYIFDLINHLEIPIVTTLHTILTEPTPKQRMVINEIGKKSEKIITMARNTKEMLEVIYGIDSEKIEVIAHGVPKKPLQSRESLKKKFGYENKQIISTFGQLGPGKGIEYGIEAIAKVINSMPVKVNEAGDKIDLLYLILGQTSPSLKEEGIVYRTKLEELVQDLAMNRSIKFVNKYLSNEEIIEYLQLSDIYMTPHLQKEQAVSGTLAYAVGYGKAIVSTPYLYAEEMLSEGIGLFAEFNCSDSLADCLKQILQDPFKQRKMERDTAKIGRKMYWDKVAQLYTNTFLNIITEASKMGAV